MAVCEYCRQEMNDHFSCVWDTAIIYDRRFYKPAEEGTGRGVYFTKSATSRQ